MSGNVVALPGKPVREWSVLKGDIEAFMLSSGHEENVIAHVCEILRPAFLESATNGNFDITTSNIEDAIRRLDISFRGVVFGLLVHLANLAIENYHLRQRIEDDRQQV